MRILTAILATLTSLTVSLGIAQAVSAPTHTGVAVIALQPLWQPSIADRLDPIPPIRYRYGDVSWLPSLAKQAGWPDHTIDKLTATGTYANRVAVRIAVVETRLTKTATSQASPNGTIAPTQDYYRSTASTMTCQGTSGLRSAYR
jgi:hypothetical protein